MEANREVKVAIVVGIIMVTVCLLLIIAQKNRNKEVTLDLHAFRHIVTDTKTGAGAYIECAISTEDLARLNAEYKKIVGLKDKFKAGSEYVSITGEYKLQSGSNFIAFDSNNKEGLVYRSDNTAFYIYNSTLYSEVEKLCENVNLNPITPDSDQETKEEETKKKDTTKKSDTKKSTKKTSKK